MVKLSPFSGIGLVRLGQRHVGVVLWVGKTASADPDPLARLGRVASALAVAARSRQSPLFVACDETSAWAWLAITPEVDLGRDESLEVLGEANPTVSMALGEPAFGVEGFRLRSLLPTSPATAEPRADRQLRRLEPAF